MIKSVLKIFGVLIVVEIILFFGMLTTSMTDEQPPYISRFFYWTLKNIFGFPLVLINDEYPFFLDNKNFSLLAIFLIIINNLIWVILIGSIIQWYRAKK